MTDSSASRSSIAIDLPRADIPKTSQCLRCNVIFTSKWCGERICSHCKSSKAWKDGMPLPSRSMERAR